MNRRRLTALLLSMPLTNIFVSVLAMADGFPDDAAIAEIRKNWRCQWCPEDAARGDHAQIDAGAAYLSNDSFRYGEYSGIDSKQAYLLFSVEYDTISDSKTRYRVSADDVGLDSRSLDMAMENPDVTAAVKYNAIPHRQSDSARTPYRGDEDQRLPSSWISATSPQGFGALNASLADIELYQLRRNFQLSMQTNPHNGLQYSLRFQQQHKSGYKSAGVAVGDNFANTYSALLALPVDNVTRQAEIAADLRRGRLSLGAAYAFSNFDNQVDAVRFDYAYSDPITVSRGQISVEPDNQMHRLSVSAQYQHDVDAQSSAQLSLAQAKQDQDYLPYSLGANLYPSNPSARARIDYFDASLRHVRRLNPQWQLLLQYRDNEQDNRSERQLFSYTIADSGNPGAARANLPFGFRTQQASASLDYHLFNLAHTLTTALTIKQQDRTYQSVAKNRDSELQVSYLAPLSKAWRLNAAVSQSQRHGSEYVAIDELNNPENPLLRNYAMADRRARSASAGWRFVGNGGFDASWQSRHSQSDYDAEIGVQDSRESFHALDMAYAFNSRWRMSAGADYFYTRSLQNGGSGFSTANWAALLLGRDRQARAALQYRPSQRGLAVSAEWAWLNSRLQATNSVDADFPEASLRRQTWLLKATYAVDANSQWQGYYRYQKYDQDNWQQDRIAIDSLSQVLTLGEVSPNYDIGFIALAYQRRW